MERKQRSDKKREIKATLPHELRLELDKRADALGVASATYAHALVMAALEDEKVIRALAPYFKRSYISGPRAWLGRVIAPSLEPLMPEGIAFSRFSIKFSQDDYLRVGEVAFALATRSLTQAVTILVSEAIVQDIEPTDILSASFNNSRQNSTNESNIFVAKNPVVSGGRVNG